MKMFAGVLCLLCLYIHGAVAGKPRMIKLGEECNPVTETGPFCGHGMRCERRDNGAGYACVGTEMCFERYARMRDAMEKGLLADAVLPQCDRKGYYEARQCYMIFTSPSTFCRCVDRYTGDMLREYPEGEFRDEEEAKTKLLCTCAQEEIAYRREGLVGLTFNCDRSTGGFSPLMCRGSRCQCVKQEGHRIPGYREFGIGESNCDCAAKKYYYELTGLIGLEYSCEENGTYKSPRCIGSVCFCADRMTGEQLPGTQAVNRGQYHTLNC